MRSISIIDVMSQVRKHLDVVMRCMSAYMEAPSHFEANVLYLASKRFFFSYFCTVYDPFKLYQRCKNEDCPSRRKQPMRELLTLTAVPDKLM